MKKFQHGFVYLLLLTSLIVLGFLISTSQSNDAQVELATNGLSENAKQIDQNQDKKIATLLTYLDKKYGQENIQVQLQNKKTTSQYLIWSNYQIPKLPVQTGRSFALNDFNGEISFVIVGQQPQIKVYETQNNRYLKVGDDYLSIIGTLKQSFYRDNYYITTGIKQATGKDSLNNYKLLIDGLSESQLKTVAKYLDGSVKSIEEIKSVITKYKSPVWIFIIAIVLVLLTILIGPALSSVDRRLLRNSQGNDDLKKKIRWNNWLKFTLSLIFINVLALVVVYVGFYFSNYYQYLMLIATIFVLNVIGYSFLMMLPERNQN